MKHLPRGAAFALALSATLLSGCSLFDSMFKESKDPLPGRRISALNLEKSLAPDRSASAAPVRLPAPYQNDSWPDAGGYPSHAMYHLALGDAIKQVWKSDIGDGANDYGRIAAQPVVAGGRVFTMDALDVVSAFDATTGKRLWRLDPAPEHARDQTYGGGVAAAADRVFVTTGYGEVLALDAAKGKELWRKSLSGPSHGAPTVTDGRVFAVTVDNQLQVLAADDGRVLWTHNGLPEPASLLGAASPAVEGDVVVVPYSSGELFGLRVENGRVLWSDNLATAQPLGALNSIADVRGQPVIDRDRVFAVSNSGLMVAIDLRTGDRVWEQDIGSTHAPWVAGDFVYVLANDLNIVCLRRQDGKVAWVRELPRFDDEEKKKDALTWTGPVLAGDRLIAISSKGEALSISPYNGQPLGRTEFDDPVFVAPTVADKTLYVLTDEADLIALR
ncbi:MAG TPA: PQQ-binding-like beta-propeller repeat protein [Stellaceae bacterium]|nr:PQQ-binding-like beta-propeller repeat protein [Stellaceae bacterium]